MEFSDEELIEISNKRKDIIESVFKTEDVLDKFSDLKNIFVSFNFNEKYMRNCHSKCNLDYKDIYEKSINSTINEESNFWKYKKHEFAACNKFCEDKVEEIISHQSKGCAISYYTFERQLNKCKAYKSEEVIDLLKCYEFKIGKIMSRFDSYYYHKRINLINRIYGDKDIN